MARAGRPRTFDRDEALKKAMLVFWEKGYEGTTMADLVAAIGTKAPSVYAAFGNKDALFHEVVALYGGIVQAGPLQALRQSPHIYAAIENSLRQNVALFTNPDNPPSCLIMTAAINCAPEHRDHVDSLRNLRAQYKSALLARFAQGLNDGQLVPEADPNTLAEFYATFVQGLALRSKDGASKQELEASCNCALHALTAYLQPGAA